MTIKHNLRVAIVIDNLSIGNISTFAINTAQAIVKAGVEVNLICGRAKGLDRLPQNNMHISILPGIGNILHFYSSHRAKKTLEDFKPTVVLYVHSKLFSKFKSIHKRHNIPALFALLNYIPQEETRFYLPKQNLKFNYNIITVSDSLRESLVNDNRLPKEKIHFINTGVDTEIFKLKKQVIGQTRPVIGTIGHLIPSKGHCFFLEAAKKTLETHPEAIFIIAGQGDEKSRLKKMVADFNLIDNVIFVDETHSTASLLHTFDIYVVPSTEEGLGFAIVEAMSCGLPVVASDVGGIYTLVKDGETGFLVPSKNSDIMAEKICYLLTNKDVCEDFRIKAREHIKRYHSLKSFANLLIEEIERVKNGE